MGNTNKIAGVARITVTYRGKIVGRDAQTIPADQVLSALTVPVIVGRSTAEVTIHFEPALRPE